jgi:hypothetical protein
MQKDNYISASAGIGWTVSSNQPWNGAEMLTVTGEDEMDTLSIPKPKMDLNLTRALTPNISRDR